MTLLSCFSEEKSCDLVDVVVDVFILFHFRTMMLCWKQWV